MMRSSRCWRRCQGAKPCPASRTRVRPTSADLRHRCCCQDNGLGAYFWVIVWWASIVFNMTYGQFLVGKNSLKHKSLWTPGDSPPTTPSISSCHRHRRLAAATSSCLLRPRLTTCDHPCGSPLHQHALPLPCCLHRSGQRRAHHRAPLGPSLGRNRAWLATALVLLRCAVKLGNRLGSGGKRRRWGRRGGRPSAHGWRAVRPHCARILDAASSHSSNEARLPSLKVSSFLGPAGGARSWSLRPRTLSSV